MPLSAVGGRAAKVNKYKHIQLAEQRAIIIIAVKNCRRRPSSDFATIHHVVSFISVCLNGWRSERNAPPNAQMCTLLRAPAKFPAVKPGQRRAAPLKTRTRALISPLNAARRPLLEHHLHTSQLMSLASGRI